MLNASNIRSTNKKKNTKRPLGIFNDAPAPRYVKIIIITALVLLLIWFLFFRGAERHSVSVDEVKARIQTTLETTQLPGRQLTSNTDDQGCDSGTSVGLQTRIECSMKGYKYIEVSGDKKTALRLADSKLESLGYKKRDNSPYANQILDGAKEGDVDYSKQYMNVRLGWSTLPSANANGPGSTAISDAISSRQIGNLDSEATVIGVVASETYWTCTSGGLDIWGLTCAFPPHTPNKK